VQMAQIFEDFSAKERRNGDEIYFLKTEIGQKKVQ
jgi:hypothetical protein